MIACKVGIWHAIGVLYNRLTRDWVEQFIDFERFMGVPDVVQNSMIGSGKVGKLGLADMTVDAAQIEVVLQTVGGVHAVAKLVHEEVGVIARNMALAHQLVDTARRFAVEITTHHQREGFGTVAILLTDRDKLLEHELGLHEFDVAQLWVPVNVGVGHHHTLRTLGGRGVDRLQDQHLANVVLAHEAFVAADVVAETLVSLQSQTLVLDHVFTDDLEAILAHENAATVHAGLVRASDVGTALGLEAAQETSTLKLRPEELVELLCFHLLQKEQIGLIAQKLLEDAGLAVAPLQRPAGAVVVTLGQRVALGQDVVVEHSHPVGLGRHVAVAAAQQTPSTVGRRRRRRDAITQIVNSVFAALSEHGRRRARNWVAVDA
mmetsp:Transcript_46327/g.116662  ORF Transcript_46327/g.116662 Transcript_46327/m.116662 type:complete len:376 (+) Transcript_46327:107-1234(+)